MPRLASITVYPIKSLPGANLAQVTLLPSGALRWDRRWAIVDAAGKFINAKRTAEIHRLRATFDLSTVSVTLASANLPAARFSLDGDLAPIEAWLGDFFREAVRLIENPAVGFPDDTDATGPTIVTTGTVNEVSQWFAPMPVDEVRRRFRANLEFDAAEPFWEDRLYGPPGEGVPFRIGDARLEGSNPCQRCVVPTRHPETAQVTANFAKRFSEHRERTLPDWADRARFDHFYRLSVNTRPVVAEAAEICVGDELTIDGCDAPK